MYILVLGNRVWNSLMHCVWPFVYFSSLSANVCCYCRVLFEKLYWEFGMNLWLCIPSCSLVFLNVVVYVCLTSKCTNWACIENCFISMLLGHLGLVIVFLIKYYVNLMMIQDWGSVDLPWIIAAVCHLWDPQVGAW